MGKALKDTKTHSLQEVSLQTEPKTEEEVATKTCSSCKSKFSINPIALQMFSYECQHGE